ncbi:hypothetical protein Tco_0979153 [Tanacetum coccineum]
MNEFNSVISKLLSVAIKFDDEMQALLLLSSLPDSWSDAVTVVGSKSGTNKLTFKVRRVIGRRVIGCEAGKGVVNVSMDAFDDALLCYIEYWGRGPQDYLWYQVNSEECEGTLYMVEILATEWSGRKLTEDVYKEAERKNAINERLCRKLDVRLCNRLRVKLYNRLRVQIYAPRAELWENLIREPLRLDFVCHGVLSNIFESLGTSKGSRTKGSVKASRRLGANGSSVNRLSLYICTNIVVGFDEVLVAESNMTKISKLKRWFSLEKNSVVLELGEASIRLLKN